MEILNTIWTNPDYLWLKKVTSISTASFIAWIIWRIAIAQFENLASKTKMNWDDAFIKAIKVPVSTLIWCWPGFVSLGLVLEHYFSLPFDWLSQLKFIVAIAVVVWALYRMVDNVEQQVLLSNKRDQTTVQAIAKVARLLVIIIGTLTIMQSLGMSLSGLLTFGGVGGLIAGLAAKDLLSNFFGGLMIYFDRPFKVGDWVRSPDRQIEGTVERIGWRMTVIRTFDKRPLYIPNSVFSSIVVENPSRMTNRRIYETIGLRYDDVNQVEPIISAVKDMLVKHPAIDSSQTMIVNFNGFGPSSLDFFVYTFTKTTNWIEFHEIKQDVLLKIADVIHQHNADIAFPTQTLKVDIESLQDIPKAK